MIIDQSRQILQQQKFGMAGGTGDDFLETVDKSDMAGRFDLAVRGGSVAAHTT